MLLSSNKLEPLQLPPHSPDMNVIENYFAEMKRLLPKHIEIDDLKRRIQFVVDSKIPISYINTLIDSMPKRLAAVVRARGELIDY